MQVGEKYIVAKTDRNQKNGLIAGKEAYISHLGPAAVSVLVIQSGTYVKLAVPRDAFGGNFDADRHAGSPNLGYRSALPFTKAYV